MALSEANARVAVTGALYYDKTAAGTAPTDGTTALNAAFKDLGYVSEDGVTVSFPDAGDVTNLKAWQNQATVRTLRTTTEDVPTISLTLIETKIEVIEAAFGVTVTSASTEGSFEFDANDTRSAARIVLSVVDGAEIIRLYAPQAVVSSIGDLTLTSTDLVGWNITLDLERNTTAGYNFKSWMTALKTPA